MIVSKIKLIPVGSEGHLDLTVDLYLSLFKTFAVEKDIDLSGPAHEGEPRSVEIKPPKPFLLAHLEWDGMAYQHKLAFVSPAGFSHEITIPSEPATPGEKDVKLPPIVGPFNLLPVLEK